MTDPESNADPIPQLLEKLRDSLGDDSFVRLTLGQPADGTNPVKKITGRKILIQGTPKLSLVLREEKRDTTRNISIDEAESWLRELLVRHYRSALLQTTHGDWQFKTSKKGKAGLVAHKPQFRQTPDREHDRSKASLLDESARPWLQALGIMNSQGKVRASMSDKHRQIAHYLEIVSHLIQQAGWKSGDAVRALDMGCGKGYLTYGLWHLLRNQLGLQAEVTGIESRKDLIDKTQALAGELEMSGLSFREGTIEAMGPGACDLLVALHACNTATDHALIHGVKSGARLILVSPCCHQEVRPLMGRPEPLAAVLRHGLFEERLSEWVTDAHRALMLEWAGYETRAIEFVSLEHTPRNLLLAAVKKHAPFSNSEHQEALLRFREFFGLKNLALDEVMKLPE